MIIKEWRIGTSDVYVGGKIAAVLNGVGPEFEVWEFDSVRRMTTGKYFGRMGMDKLIEMYGPLDEERETGEGRRKRASGNVKREQLTLFDARCDCGCEPDVIQQTIYEDEYYCHACYSAMSDEKGDA